MNVARTALALAVLTSPALAWDKPEDVAGNYRLGPPDDRGSACELELLSPIAYEFEGVWYVARPLHYEDNRAACRRLGVDDVIAWSGVGGETLWLLAEGDAGFMEFTPGTGGWRLEKSGHATVPDFVLARVGD